MYVCGQGPLLQPIEVECLAIEGCDYFRRDHRLSDYVIQKLLIPYTKVWNCKINLPVVASFGSDGGDAMKPACT